jgi:hypothetical protein
VDVDIQKYLLVSTAKSRQALLYSITILPTRRRRKKVRREKEYKGEKRASRKEADLETSFGAYFRYFKVALMLECISVVDHMVVLPRDLLALVLSI